MRAPLADTLQQYHSVADADLDPLVTWKLSFEDQLVHDLRVRHADLAGLRQLASKHRGLVTDVRGKGLRAAFELRSPAASNRVMQEAFTRGMRVLPTGAQAIRLCPALTVSSDEISVGLEILDASCAAVPSAD